MSYERKTKERERKMKGTRHDHVKKTQRAMQRECKGPCKGKRNENGKDHVKKMQ
jgi:hypothetical protein